MPSLSVQWSLPESTIQQIKQLVAGLPPAEARAKLQLMEQAGMIGPIVAFPDDLPQLPAAEDIDVRIAP